MTRLAMTYEDEYLGPQTVIFRVPNMLVCCPHCRRGPQLGAKYWRVVNGKWEHACPEKP